MILDKLIVMDEVSGLAGKSDEFANLVTLSKNTDCRACTFFILFTLLDKIGK